MPEFEPTAAWAQGMAWVFDTLTAVVLAAIVMQQWLVWFMVTSLIWDPWGMAIGLVIAATQILGIFDPCRSQGESCELPHKA